MIVHRLHIVRIFRGIFGFLNNERAGYDNTRRSSFFALNQHEAWLVRYGGIDENHSLRLDSYIFHCKKIAINIYTV